MSEIPVLGHIGAAWERFVHGQIAGCVEVSPAPGCVARPLLKQLPSFLSEAQVLPAPDLQPTPLELRYHGGSRPAVTRERWLE